VQASITYTLGSTTLENLTLTGNANINGTGNGIANVIVGNSNANTLSGLAGADTLTGGAGADHFLDTAANLNGDRITDLSAEDFIDVTGVRFAGVRYTKATGLLELDTAGNGSYATKLTVSSGLDGVFLSFTSPAGDPAATQIHYMADSDADGIPDYQDNAINVPNPDQRDTDGDGYGNATDADFNQDHEVDIFDLAMMDDAFFGSDADMDMNGDGFVDVFDLAMLDDLFGKSQTGTSYVDLPVPKYIKPSAFVAPGPAAQAVTSVVGIDLSADRFDYGAMRSMQFGAADELPPTTRSSLHHQALTTAHEGALAWDGFDAPSALDGLYGDPMEVALIGVPDSQHPAQLAFSL
ncbi:hypothetical protein WG898_25085, partial [Paucibacter sp. AS307]